MTVYVDQLFDAAGRYHGDQADHARRVGGRHGHRWCHLLTDGPDEELHRFAARLGLKRSWFQGDHYDLVPSKRALAVRLGAVELDRQGLYDLLVRRRGARS